MPGFFGDVHARSYTAPSTEQRLLERATAEVRSEGEAFRNELKARNRLLRAERDVAVQNQLAAARYGTRGYHRLYNGTGYGVGLPTGLALGGGVLSPNLGYVGMPYGNAAGVAAAPYGVIPGMGMGVGPLAMGGAAGYVRPMANPNMLVAQDLALRRRNANLNARERQLLLEQDLLRRRELQDLRMREAAIGSYHLSPRLSDLEYAGASRLPSYTSAHSFDLLSPYERLASLDRPPKYSPRSAYLDAAMTPMQHTLYTPRLNALGDPLVGDPLLDPPVI